MVKHPHQSLLTPPPLYYIKGKSVKACCMDMPCNCWGEHCMMEYIAADLLSITIMHTNTCSGVVSKRR